MPSVSDRVHVDIDFEWDEIINERLSTAEVAEVAKAIAKAGKANDMIKAILAVKRGEFPPLTDEELHDLEHDVDHLVNDYLRGIPIEPHIRSIARHHCNRIII